METTYYTLTAREIIVSGDCVAKAAGGTSARQLVCVRRPAQGTQRADNVIDLAAWKAAKQPESFEDAPAERPEAGHAAVRADRGQSGRRAVLVGGELLATLSVIGTMAILMARLVLA